MEAKKEPGKPGLTSSSREFLLRLATEPGNHGHTQFVRWFAPEKVAVRPTRPATKPDPKETEPSPTEVSRFEPDAETIAIFAAIAADDLQDMLDDYD
jgi:hypothetical protein